MTEQKERFIVFKTKVWIPSAVLGGADEKEMEQLRTMFDHLAKTSFKQEIEAKIPDALVTFLSGFMPQAKNEVKSYIAERSKVEVDIE